MSDYGLWPLDTVTSWLADDTMVLAARAGTSIGPSIYDELPSRLTRAPKSVSAAYEQATYFVALGARRAMREGETTATNLLLADLDQLLAEGEVVSQEVNFFCQLTGFGCPRGGAGRVLADAIDAIEDSGLNADDVLQITTYLKANRRALIVQRAVPIAAVLGVSVAAGLWWQRRA